MATSLEDIQIGMQNMCLDTKLSCANNSEDPSPCRERGTSACKDCLLISYCSRRCQTAHWPIHRKDCKSPLRDANWKPSRTDLGWEQLDTTRGVWGQVPPVDVIRLDKNEGDDFQGPLNILFTLSEDIKDTILSVANLPKSFQGPLHIVINDNEIDVVARNAIILLIFFLEEDPLVAAEYALHIWYSAFITDSCFKILERIKPMIQEVCDVIEKKPESTLLSKRWTVGNRSLRLVLTRSNWFFLLSRVCVQQELTKDAAEDIRRDSLSCPRSTSYVDILMNWRSPHRRPGIAKFLEDGILLPFGESRRNFIIPNPTLFNLNKKLLMRFEIDLIAAWSPKSLLAYKIGPAENDLYGKLHHYLRSLLADFHRRMSSLTVNFELQHLDIGVLPRHLDGLRFDRIYANDLSDMYEAYFSEVLKLLRPLLQPTSVNRRAALISLFRWAGVRKTNCEFANPPPDDTMIKQEQMHAVKILMYMPQLLRSPPTDINALKICRAYILLSDMDYVFRKFITCQLGRGIAEARMNIDYNTIVDPWPWRIPNGTWNPEIRETDPYWSVTEEEKEYFSLLSDLFLRGQERYVEWRLSETEWSSVSLPPGVRMVVPFRATT